MGGPKRRSDYDLTSAIFMGCNEFRDWKEIKAEAGTSLMRASTNNLGKS